MNRLATLAAATAMVAFGASAQAKTLVYCSEGSPDGFNPMLQSNGTAFDADRPIYNRLVQFKPGTTEVGEGLAEKWDVSPDGKVFTFHLRHDAKWHSNKNFKPTRGFDADDVMFSFERQWKDSSAYHKVSGGSYEYWGDMEMAKLIASIDKVDQYTVKFTLTVPQAPFLSDLAMDFAAIQSAEYADVLTKMGKPELIDQEPIGTGPFELVQYVKDATIRYRAFPGFWGEKPKLDALVFSINKDPAVRLAKLRADECQVMPFPSPADLPSIRDDKNLQLISQPGLNVGYLALNALHKPFDDVRVRQAINMAIDKQAIISAVYQSAGQPAKNLIPPTMWSYDTTTVDYKYDPEAAKKLLAAAGLPDGFETTLWAMPVQRPYNPDAKRIAELMQADLAKIGIKAKIVSYEWGDYLKRVRNAEADMAELGWTGDNGDPDNFFVPLAGCSAAKVGGGNAAHWCNQDFEALVDKAATLSDQAERSKLYQQAQVIMHDQAPFFLIAHSVVNLPMRSNVVGYKMSPLGAHDFSNVDLK